MNVPSEDGIPHNRAAAQPLDGVMVSLRQTGGAEVIFAAVTAATLVPFVQALASRAADSAYDLVRRRLHAGADVTISCPDRQLAVIVTGSMGDDALRQFANLDFDRLPAPCMLRWDAEHGTWLVTPS